MQPQDIDFYGSFRSLNRRNFLRRSLGSAAAVSLLPLGWQFAVGEEPKRPPSLISRLRNPDNYEFPFGSLDSFITPTDLFYVRNHFDTPALDTKTWKLRVEGEVAKPFELSFAELTKMKATTMPALLECAGNSRVLLKPPQGGIRWEQGGVSNAEWTGVPLAAVLERAGIKSSAVEVVLEGADKGSYAPPDPKSPGVVPFARSLPIQKAQQPEVLLAYKMNGEPLTPNHGYPVRVVVPGWYGMASIKWLTRIVATPHPFHGFFQTFMYTRWQRTSELADLVPVSTIGVKSQIARPAYQETISAGGKYRVFGAAWSGESTVAKVELSEDGGKSWSAVRLLDKPIKYAWRLWEHDWKVPAKPGTYTLMSRATDDQGEQQPVERDSDRRDGMINHIQKIVVHVR